MAAVSKIENGVVELRTDVGRLYVCPSGWQRLYLRWTFRNFHCLPQQVLNPRQQRLVEQLWRKAIVTSSEPVEASCIIGIVENMQVLGLATVADTAEAKTAKPAAGEAALAVLQARAEEAETELRAPAPAPRPPARRVPDIPHGALQEPADGEPQPALAAATNVEHDLRARRQKPRRRAVVLAGAAAAGVVALLAFWLMPLMRMPQIATTPPAAPPAPAVAKEVQPAATSGFTAKHMTAGLTAGQVAGVSGTRAAHAMKAAGHPAADVAAKVPASTPLPQIVEAPRSGFIYPVAPNPNLVGKVVLSAVVGSDGTVKQVAVLSGDRALAAAAVRAVRQWRYAPAEVGGHTVEAETQVTISFLGDDAVSIILPQQR